MTKTIWTSTARLLIGAIILLGIFTARAAERTPEQTIRDFYAWYVGQLDAGKDPFTDGRAALAGYVTKRLLKELEAKRKAGEMDADYFLNAQDFDSAWGKNAKVSAVQTKGESASAKVELKSAEMGDQKLSVQLAQEAGAWKIDRVEPQ